MSKIIGIDLGTTNSVVAVLEGGEAKIIPNKEGGRTTPSVVAFQDGDQRLVGGPAKRQAVTNPTNTLFSIKRFMGRRHEEVSDEEKMVPYGVTGAASEPVRVQANGKDYSPEEISSYILGYLKECAEDYLGEKVTTHSAKQQKTRAKSLALRSTASSTSQPLQRLLTAWTRKLLARLPCLT